MESYSLSQGGIQQVKHSEETKDNLIESGRAGKVYKARK